MATTGEWRETDSGIEINALRRRRDRLVPRERSLPTLSTLTTLELLLSDSISAP
jgi:hypothetical protein